MGVLSATGSLAALAHLEGDIVGGAEIFQRRNCVQWSSPALSETGDERELTGTGVGSTAVGSTRSRHDALVPALSVPILDALALGQAKERVFARRA
jgi:hypothetical protein